NVVLEILKSRKDYAIELRRIAKSSLWEGNHESTKLRESGRGRPRVLRHPAPWNASSFRPTERYIRYPRLWLLFGRKPHQPGRGTCRGLSGRRRPRAQLLSHSGRHSDHLRPPRHLLPACRLRRKRRQRRHSKWRDRWKLLQYRWRDPWL